MKKLFKVTYSGNALRFKEFEAQILASSKRDAVEKVFSEVMTENYFPQEDGSILDCDGDVLADPEDLYIEYDGGKFSAEETN